MQKPKYEYSALIRGIERCKKNIKAMEEAIEKERELMAEMQFYKRQHELYREWLKTHGNSN